jgi:hypothetical protein
MIPGVVGSSQYVVPGSGTFGTSVPGGTGGTGTVGPKWSAPNGYVYWDDAQADIMSASPFPSGTFEDRITTGLGASADYDEVTQLSYENGFFFLCRNGSLTKEIIRITPSTWAVTSRSVTPGANVVIWHDATSQYLAFGDSGQMWTSSSGTSWNKDIAIATSNINCAATDGNLVVAMFNNGDCYTSTDLENWTLRTSSFGTTAIYRIVYVPTTRLANVSGTKGVWFATGASAKAAYSTNGTSWTQKTTGASGNIFMAAYHMGRFFALGNASGQTLRRSNTSDPSGTWAQVSATTYNDAVSGGSSGGYLYFIDTAGEFHYAR